MKYYHSDFSQSDTEYLYQQIEELKKYLSQEALFLMEEEPTIKGQVRIVLKVKDKDSLFLVDSTASSILQAAWAAKEAMIELVLNRQKQSNSKELGIESKIIYN